MHGPSTSIDTGYLSLHYLLMCLVDVHYLRPYRQSRILLVSMDNASVTYSPLSIERAQRETIAEGSYV